jgi:hypothetical protein
MKLERIEITDYTLWVSDEEYKKNEIIVETKLGWIMKATEHGLPNYNPNKKKVIAYQPKTDNAPELDLPLLPQIIVEDDIARIVDKEFADEFKIAQYAMPAIWYDFKLKIIKFLNAATKKYSEEDLKKAILMARRHDVDLHDGKGCTLIPQNTEDEIIQSLKKSKPKYFLPEFETVTKGTNEFDFYEESVMKTEVVDGKTYLKGKYLYE